ncbi:glycoprotein precursor [Tigray virus]|uniref:Envelopment polyprotein n=1 Tax=Tigray virus TaxID=1268011 RepID=A0A1C9TA33_9VIRU|nr:glycoprotein precursor [Tigray virus]
MDTFYWLLMGMRIIAVCAMRNVYELTLECPHTIVLGETLIAGSTLLPPLDITKVPSLELESSCGMEVYSFLDAKQKYTQVDWRKKSDHTGSATSTSFEVTEKEVELRGTCVIPTRIFEMTAPLKKAIVCYDLICNQSMCKPEIHMLSPSQSCNVMRNCIIGLGPYRIQVVYKKTYCTSGILVEGKCFRPDKNLMGRVKPGFLEMATIPAICFMISKKDAAFKLIERIEKVGEHQCSSNEHKMQGYYACVIGKNSEIVKVPDEDDSRSLDIFDNIKHHPYGEDHDRDDEDISAVRLAGTIEFKVPHTESANNMKGTCYSGVAEYTSLSAFTKEDTPKYVFTPGMIPFLNQSACNKKGLPLVWSGLVEVGGTFEQIHTCNVFCVLSGPGASCEAFSEGGIFNISSPNCLVSKQNSFKQAEQQITFVCQRVDTDIIVYCNGQKKVILTKTLIIGQCIYTVTSFFSVFSSIAHSLAIELCVPGFHGWATIILVVTFCFGWILIPAFTWFILNVLKLCASFLDWQNKESKFKFILKKIKEEYERTKGSMVCDICKHECDTQKELKAHQTSCIAGQCPYCLTGCEVSEAAYRAHFGICRVTHRFQDDLKKVTVSAKPTPGCYRTLSLFRYKSRCYIFTVWVILLLLESVIWAASAEPEFLKPEWNDNAHGVGKVTMDKDLELDFSLLSSSQYTYRRVLADPRIDGREINFHLEIDSQRIQASVQPLGHWFDGRLNIKTAFHCYGSCNKYHYPWQTATCQYEKDFQYENSWSCNPPDCPGVGTGCTACGLYVDNLKAVGTAFRLVALQYSRKVCIQLGEEHICKVVDINDCLTTLHYKVCIIGTVSKFQAGDTLLFLGPMEGGGLILKQWCNTNCQFGDPGDIMKRDHYPFSCPEYPGSIRKVCHFAKLPLCEYNGNLKSGYKKLLDTIDSFQSFNVSYIHYTTELIEWRDPDGLLRDHINVVVSRGVDFESLNTNPCKVTVQTISIDGAWGSGVGFNLKCQVSLTECSKYLTAIKACDKAICYGAVSVSLSRGHNIVTVTGKGGHSGSRFKCCHSDNCSDTGLLASAPHLDRVNGIDAVTETKVFDDGAPECGFICWTVKSAEWLAGIFKGNWMVVIALIVLLLISLLLLSFLCPVKKYKKV